MSMVEPFHISRVFNAPRALVFLAHTDVAHVSQWMSPGGFQVIHADMDLRAGGSYHYGIRGPDGSEMWGLQRYVEIVAPQKLVYIQAFSDKDRGLARHPMSPTWPLEMETTVTFDDLGDGTTRVNIAWQPHNADAAALATFDGARDGMAGGFTGMFANLDAHLAAHERQLVHSRLIDAPRALVWRALTEPAHVNAWWGPNGFRNVDVTQDVRLGGEWKFTMIGPDGTTYPNKSTYIELVPPERLVYDCGDFDNVMFRGEITLQPIGERTLVTLAVVVSDRAIRDGLLGYALEGGQQTLAKLAAHVAGMTA